MHERPGKLDDGGDGMSYGGRDGDRCRGGVPYARNNNNSRHRTGQGRLGLEAGTRRGAGLVYVECVLSAGHRHETGEAVRELTRPRVVGVDAPLMYTTSSKLGDRMGVSPGERR